MTWAPRDSSGPVNAYSHGHGHSRQRSISNAINRMRSGSMSQNAHEIAEALRAPVSYKLIVWDIKSLTMLPVKANLISSL